MTSRVLRALSAFALFVGAASLLPGNASAAAARSAAQPVEVGISQVSPQVPDFSTIGSKMNFSGVVKNTGSTTLKNLHLQVWRSMVTNRSALGSADGQGFELDLGKKVSDKLAPNASATWTLSPTELQLFGLQTPYAGVYAFDFDVMDEDGHFLGGQRTFLVWKPKEMSGAQQARVALMWPVVGQPGLTGQKMPNSSEAPILADQSTAQQYAQGGRLSKVLQAGAGLPLVNWLVDPDVLATANQLVNGYFAPDPKNNDKLTGYSGNDPGSFYNQASGILTSAQAQNCWSLLYGDPDVNTLSRTAAGRNLLTSATGIQAPATGGCRPGNPAVAWPSDGQADATTLAALAGTKVSNMVTLLGSNAVSTWPSAHASLPNSPNTVVYDNYLSNIFTDPAKPAAPSLSNAGVLAGQEWLAQTALANTEGSHILVVTPPRDFDPPQELLSAIKAMSTVPTKDQWFGLDSLSQVVGNTPATPQKASALSRITTANQTDAAVNSASDSQQLYHALHAVITDQQYDTAVPFRPIATWWRDHPGGPAYGKTVYDTVVTDHGLVSFGTQTPPLTMSGKSGTVPVTIKNDTDAPITIYLRAQDTGAHTMELKVAEDQGPHSINKGQSATVRIPVQALGNGQPVTLQATLYTCKDTTENCTYYPANLSTPLKANTSVTYVTVKVSRIGIIALGLMIGSGFLLILLIGLRVYRAKRTHHAPAQDTMAS
ncbi:hypothetical protein ABH926_001804 [Catenulispora sp. GP43]|uniref:hypothetical protein n=1 Tax=Catenulispora sp. GP43 TaxID=3156263 RepID=UPI0035185115